MLGLPRGGIPVAAEVGVALGVPVDALVVRKLGAPGHPELAMGAVGPGEVTVRNEDVISSAGVAPATFAAVVRRERAEIARREAAYRGGRAAAEVRDFVVVLVDDGLATGATMRAAIAVVLSAGATEVVVAVPVAPRQTCEQLSQVGAEVVCLRVPAPFPGVGAFYGDFSAPSDGEVRRLLLGGSSTTADTPRDAWMEP